jgi:hypothetical protein
MTMNCLAKTLGELGRREEGTKGLIEAANTWNLALEECTRERMPFEWAKMQNNLAYDLLLLGSRETGTESLQKSAEASGQALLERPRERNVPLWTTTMNNLGEALALWGAREAGTERLREAVPVLRSAHEGLREMKTLTADDEAEFDRRINGLLLMIAQREHF